MFNPIDYFIDNLRAYTPIYNIAWVLFMLYALTLPVLLLAAFHRFAVLRQIQPPATWHTHRKTYGYLLGAMGVIFAFRFIPYWIFTDTILHFLGGGIAIALVYEYLLINLQVPNGNGIFSLRGVPVGSAAHLTAHFVFLLLFASFFSVFSELYEFASKILAGYQFDSSGLDTWIDILANLSGALCGYAAIWGFKYRRQPNIAKSSASNEGNCNIPSGKG